ncbi:MAG TPA: biotin carboxylase N-terminal domain-containing protein, partial [Candidatus Limnocylindrales bacterium]
TAAAPSGTIVPIRTLFIANRGEIVTRIRRTTDRLGIRASAPGLDDVPEVNLLDIGAVVAAALASGADVLHPGFGFLSENAAFAEAVEVAGIRWVGPPPSAIRAMGDKASARRRAAGLGIPIVPGYDGDDQSDRALLAAARKIAGKPRATSHAVLIKPAAGGGGKGMRVVRGLADPRAFLEALAAARREAALAFGDPRLILERFLTGPRHVEVQVLFDAAGHGVHLGERDCSLQRRHQKVLEESPSPAVDDRLRERLGEAALKLAGSVGYRSAGTCEFLLDDDGSYHFLEMNTRLQVEHPVTELITGRDLVADQLRIAAGEPLGFSQADADTALKSGGHALEVRLYAEDPDAGFLPTTGRIEVLAWPEPPVRVDTGIEAGSVVDTRFDPMLAKVIVGGRNRAEAITNMSTALDAALVLGLTTNLHFLRWLVGQPVVVQGEARIDTLEAIWPPAGLTTGSDGPEFVPSPAAWQAAARALAPAVGDGWRLNSPARIRLTSEGHERSIERVPASVREVSPACVVDAAGTAFVDDDGRSVAFQVAPPPDVDRAARAAAAHGSAGGAQVDAPMPGSVLGIHVGPGRVVEAGQPLLTLEAMKMEHVVVAPIGGVVTEVLAELGEQVARGRPLLTLAASPGPIAAEPLP